MTKRKPLLRQHKASGRAVVTLTDSATGRRHDFYCGPWGEPESHERYARLVRAWASNDRRLPQLNRPSGLDDDGGSTIGELILAYWKHASSYHCPGQVQAIKSALRIPRQLYGSTSAAGFTPMQLEMVRDAT
ncbi:MAG: hypothetical protein IT445_15985 [Phycisphaeraceae bacterium]|nr:hypothetical protein [Phycisphaeraceae bacterium]